MLQAVRKYSSRSILSISYRSQRPLVRSECTQAAIYMKFNSNLLQSLATTGRDLQLKEELLRFGSSLKIKSNDFAVIIGTIAGNASPLANNYIVQNVLQ